MLDHHVQRVHAAVTGAPVDRPDHVAEPASQFVGDVLGGEFPQAAEVECAGPSGGAPRGDEPDEQVLHDAPVVEQAFVGGVVHEEMGTIAGNEGTAVESDCRGQHRLVLSLRHAEDHENRRTGFVRWAGSNAPSSRDLLWVRTGSNAVPRLGRCDGHFASRRSFRAPVRWRRGGYRCPGGDRQCRADPIPRSATAPSTFTIRSRNRVRVRSSQARKATAERGSRRATRSAPRRSSPNVRTLRNSSSGLRSRNQVVTNWLARSRLRSSETTFVSRRYFTVQPAAAPSAPGRSRHRRRRQAAQGDDR